MYDEDHLVLRLSRKDSTSHSYRGTNARSRSVAIIFLLSLLQHDDMYCKAWKVQQFIYMCNKTPNKLNFEQNQNRTIITL